MIIKSTRIRSGDAGRATGYVLAGPSPIGTAFASEAEARCSMNGDKYCLRHWQISPQQELTTDELREAVRLLCDEFEINPAELLVNEHRSPRSNGSSVHHFHILAPQRDEQGRSLSSSNDRLRHEKLSRRMEHQFGHELVAGRHNRAVAAALTKEGHHELAERLHPATQAERPRQSYSRTAERKAARMGVDLPSIAHELSLLKGQEPGAIAAGLAAIEADHGVRFEQGHRKKEGRGREAQPLILKAGDQFITSASRSLDLSRSETTKILRNLENVRTNQRLDNEGLSPAEPATAVDKLPAGADHGPARSGTGEPRDGRDLEPRGETRGNRGAGRRASGRDEGASRVVAAAKMRSHLPKQSSPMTMSKSRDAMAALRAWSAGRKRELRMTYRPRH